LGVGGGATWRDVDTLCAAHRLAVPGGTVDTSGVAGLTLGGGIGYLIGSHGLTLDNLLSAQVALADGSVVTAAEATDADLFWALRGGGGNFGVVTEFEFVLHPLPDVWGGCISFAQPHLGDAVRMFRDVMASAPDELVLMVILGEGEAEVMVCFAGDAAAGEEAVAPLREQLPVLRDRLGPPGEQDDAVAGAEGEVAGVECGAGDNGFNAGDGGEQCEVATVLHATGGDHGEGRPACRAGPADPLAAAMPTVAELTEAAREVELTRDPSRRLPHPEADDEVAELARTLEGMLAALDSARANTESMLDRQREFVADASHELRTPLTSVLANLELLAEELEGEQAETAQAALRSTRRMRRLVGDLLLLARADAHREQQQRPTDLGDVLMEAAGELGPLAEHHELMIEAETAPVPGVRDDLHRLTLNLLENAVRHTPPGTSVSARTGIEDGSAILAVEDDGPGIAPELR